MSEPGTAGNHGRLREPDLELRIGELVLHGFEPGQRYAIASAVEAELALLLDPDATGRDGVTRGAPSVDGGSFEIPRNASSGAIGTEIARAIHRGLGAAADGGPLPEGGPP